MNRILLFLVLTLAMPFLALAQVTQLASNNSLNIEVPLGRAKAILAEASHGKLWVTDATTGGTFRLSDTIVYNNAGGLLNDKFIFAATSPTFGAELWITDGTVNGTKLLKDIYPGTTGAEPHDDFVLLDGYLYFSAATPGEGRELWRTNGTPEGTTLVKDVVPGPAGSALKGRYDMFSDGTYLLFNSVTATEGYELWRSDGTAAGTFLLKDINPGAASSEPAGYHAHNGIVLFWAQTTANGRELWRTDGTAGGTQLVKDVRPGTASSVNVAYPMPNISILCPFNNRLLFIADDGTTGEEIWTTDGTTAGTYLLKDINPGADRSFVSLLNGVPMNSKLFFSAYMMDGGAELWETDGTPAGTKLFKEILPGSDSGIPFLMPNLQFTGASGWPVHQGSHFYFLFGLPVAGVELWKSDGTVTGTHKIKTLKTTDNDISNVSYLYTTAGLYFSTDNGTLGDELWKSDGTEAGTTLVIDLNHGAEGSDISFFPIPVNNKYIFTATNGDNEFMWDLYRLDGNLVPLPLKLESFTAFLAGADGQLRWQTSLEQGTLEFVVERSHDGKLFSPIGTVAAAGNSAGKRNYSFTDSGVANSGRSIVYYRLLMRDRDGKETHSRILRLHPKAGAAFTVQVLGNPVQSELRLSFAGTTAPVNLSIRDASGRTVKGVHVKNENSVVAIPVSGMVAGTYFISAECNGKSSVVKFLKQ